ncbi:MAG TPA: hypothetical protein VI318_12655, partial [Baekduia sp.]
CLLFYVLTGVAPYRRDSDEATLYAHLNDPPPDATALSPDVPPALADVVDRALAKDPDDRFPSAGDLGRAALAAVGDGPAPPPERVVARGAAAPGGFLDDETAIPDAGSRTPTAPTALAGRGGGAGTPTRRRAVPGWVAPVASLVAGAAVVLVAVLLISGGKDDNNTGAGAAGGTPSSTTPDATAGAHVVKTYKVDPRPNAIAYARGRVWVASSHTGRLIGIPARGNGAQRTIKLPWKGGTTSVAAGFGSLWVTNGEQARLVRINPATGALQGDRALGSGEVVVVAAGEGAVWVGRRAIKTTDPPSSIVKVDPKGGRTAEIPFGQEGVSWITTGGGYVWVPNRRRARVSRIDPATGARKSTAIGNGKHRAVFGANAIWVTNYDDGTVTENNRALDNDAPVALPVRGPLGIAYGAHTIWVAGQLDNAVVRIDPAKGEVVGDPIEVGRSPFAVAAHGRSAWVTNLASASVTRIDLG